MRYIILLVLVSNVDSVFAAGILEYDGQNYLTGMGVSGFAVDYALGAREELDGLSEFNVINDNKFYFIDYLPGIFNIEGKLLEDGCIKYGEEIETITALTNIPFDVIEGKNGKRRIRYSGFEIIYHGEAIYYNSGIDFNITIVGYAADRKIIITEIFLSEEDLEKKIDEFRHVYSEPLFQ